MKMRKNKASQLEKSTIKEELPITSKTELLKRWHDQVNRSRYAHYATARHFYKWKLRIGLPSIGASTLAGGSAVFSGISDRTEPMLVIAIGVLSLIAATLTALQTFLGYSAKAEEHRAVGAEYGAIRREIEVAQEKLARGVDIVDVELHYQLVDLLKRIEKQMDELGKTAPSVPENLWDQACEKFDMRT